MHNTEHAGAQRRLVIRTITATSIAVVLMVLGAGTSANASETDQKAIRDQIIAAIAHPKSQVITDDITADQANALMNATTKRLDSTGFDKLSLVCRDGYTMHYRLFKPVTKLGEKYPLVVYYHGRYNEGSDNTKQLMSTVVPRFWALPEVQQKHPCYVLLPQLPAELLTLGKAWKDHAIAEHKELYDLLVKTYSNIDTKRVYLTGHSMGGSQVLTELAQYPDLYAAGLASDGGAGGGNIDKWAQIYASHHVNLMMFCGSTKDLFDFARTGLAFEEKTKALGGTLTCVIYPNLDHWQVGNTFVQEPGVLDWLFAQHR